MPVEPGLVDANVLAYAMNADAPQHLAARSLIEMALQPSAALYVSSQVLCEFYSIITNERRVRNACSSAEAVRIIFNLLSLPGLRILPVPEVVAGWMRLLALRPVTGAGVFDLQIAATMLANVFSGYTPSMWGTSKYFPN